jgi:hypothetical protein
MPTAQRKVTLSGGDCRYRITTSKFRIIIGAVDQGTSDQSLCRVKHGKEKTRKAERATHHWHATVSAGMPLGWHVVAVSYWTIIILLGWYPWNILLMLLAFPAMDFSRRNQTYLCREACLVDPGAPR